MTDYDLIAPFYNIEHAHFDEDLNLYTNFAELCGSPLLELACGSGRLLVPLARQGYELTGVDSSASMLKLAQEALEQAGVAAQCKLAQENMCRLSLGQKFRLAFIALGSFGHVCTRQEQRQTLAAVRDHLTTGGRFILDISNADVRYMEHLSGQMLHQGTWQREDGALLSHFVSPASSLTKHLLELTHFYEEHRQGEAVRRTVITTHLYLFERNEVELLLEEAGFGIADVYGDYELDPCEHDSPRMIFIAEAR
ncbi:MAG TPA: class I SAM-dependent methyltransferase [Ktedonobacteraceae bacterium]